MSTSFTKRALKKIPQFDFLTLGAQITGIFIGLFCFYYFIIKFIISNVLAINKLRIKKYSENIIEKINIKKELNQFLKLVTYKFKIFIQKI